MKCFMAVALALGWIALPACAQHGAAHGAFSGHAGSGSRGGFAATAPARSSGFRGYSAPRAPAFARGKQRSFTGSPLLRRPFNGPWRYRHPYVPHDRGRVFYGLPSYGWVSPYYLGYPDDLSDDDSSAPQDNGSALAANGYEEPQEPDQGPYQQQPPLPAWQPPASAASPQTAPAPEQSVTLIFKDGRPAEQIHNYILTRTTLYVEDQHHRTIPTGDLDLVATARVNQDAGVDFQLPNSLK